MRVVVVGGCGFFGSRVVTAMRAAGADVAIAGKSGRCDVRIDAEHADSAALAGYDVVINCADTLAASPDHLREMSLRVGALYIETTSDPGAMMRALQGRRSMIGSGVAVLGLGIFPGLSNLAARAVYEQNQREGPIEVAMRFSPFTGAGGGMVALIAHLMAEPAPYYERGTRKTASAFSRGKPMPFEGEWVCTLRAAIPEADLLHATLGCPDITALLSPRPAFLIPLLRVAAMLAPRSGVLRRAYEAIIRGSVGLIRRVLFRKKPTYVVVSALADRRGDKHSGRYVNLATPDGVLAGAYMIAAAVQILCERRPSAGTYVVDEVVQFDEVLDRMAKLPGAPQVRVQHSAAAPSTAKASA